MSGIRLIAKFHRPFKRQLSITFTLFLISLAIAGLGSATLAGQDWVSRLQPPAQGTYWQTDETLILLLPPNLPDGSLDRLTLELNAGPAAVAVERRDDATVLRLLEPLTAGTHDLRLLEKPAEGPAFDHGSWHIEVRPPPQTAEETAEDDDGLWSRISRLLANEDNKADAVTDQGRAVVKDDRWEAAVHAERESLDRQAQTAGAQAGEEYQMELRFRDEHLASEGRLGRHATGAESLVVDGSAQPGASLSLETTDSRARVTGFARTQEARLTDDPAYAPEGPDRQIQGTHLAVKPLAALKDNLEVTGTYYRGQLVEGSDTAATEAGDGWSLATDTRWLDRRLQLRGELAGTQHDPDGAAGSLDPVTGQAYAGLANVTLLRDREVAGSTLDWDLGLEAERLGSGFASLANPSAEANQQTTALTSRLSWDDYALEAKGSQRLGNIEDLAGLPRERTRDLELGGSYAPTRGPDEAPLPAWLGKPSIGLAFGVEDRRQTPPPDEAGGPLASREVDTTLRLGSDYQSWGWNLSQTLGSATDQAFGEAITSKTGLGARVALGERLVLAPNGQWSKAESLATREAERSWELGLQADVELLPETLTSSFNYAYGTTWDPASTEVTQALGGELLWRFREAEADRPAMALSLAGSVEDRWDLGLADTRTRDYQVFLNLRLSLPDGSRR